MSDNRPAYNLHIRAATRRSDASGQEIVVYHWGRILGVFLVGVIVLAILGFLLWSWVSGSGATDNQSRLVAAGKVVTQEPAMPEPSTPTATENSAGEPMNGLPETVETVESPQTGSQPSDAQAELAEPGAPVSDDTQAETNAIPDETSATGTGMVLTREPEPSVIADPAQAPEPTDDTGSDNFAVEEPAPEPSIDDGDSRVDITSDHLLRAQLTPAVDGHEPTTMLPSVVHMGDDDLIKVYYFNELKGLKGHTVYNDWYLGDKRVARVPIDAYLDQMRAFSSKNINRSMLGDWRVKTVTDEGDVLATGHFRVVE
ncbi:DUF2914 domain-containing protein [Marinobacter halodurans]|uniref:DUF2914 domain-containing protein n=1 Tax=Marinobacter halodurans TaxID=2528979 RepID=A0ABY1ZFZ8_9GAMM|nr:DUF2914 domain-containing protein [Marinobacter halodurans]TBW50358.1 DUF2914 domain-containing protein [Marinobacter halodurans]